MSFLIKNKNSLDYLVKAFFCRPTIQRLILEESTIFLFLCVKDLLSPSLVWSSCNQDVSQTHFKAFSPSKFGDYWCELPHLVYCTLKA